MSVKRVYVLLSASKESFVLYCRSGRKIWNIPGHPCKVLDSLESAKEQCRKLNRDDSNCVFVYFYTKLYFFSS